MIDTIKLIANVGNEEVEIVYVYNFEYSLLKKIVT